MFTLFNNSRSELDLVKNMQQVAAEMTVKAKELLEFVLFPNTENIIKLKEMVKTHPHLFFIRATAYDQAKDLQGNRRTIEDWSPYQAMFGTGDSDLLAELKPQLDTYLATIPNGNVIARAQVEEKFPNGFHFPPSTYDFETLAAAIKSDQGLWENGIPNSTTVALMSQMQHAFKPGTVKLGHHFNMNDNIKVLEIYYRQVTSWSVKQSEYFSRNIIGFFQRLKTGFHLQREIAGYYKRSHKATLVKRDYTLHSDSPFFQINFVVVPLDSDTSMFTLGREFVIDRIMGGGAFHRSGGIWHGTAPANILDESCRANADRLVSLLPAMECSIKYRVCNPTTT